MNVEAAAAYQITNNGRVVDTGYIEGNYDGNKAKIIGTDGEKISYMQLTNEDINRLLAVRASSMPLEKRITSEYLQPHMRKQSRRRTRVPRSRVTRGKRASSSSQQKKVSIRRTSNLIPRSQNKVSSTRRRKTIPVTLTNVSNGANNVVTMRAIDTPVVRDTPGAYKE